MRRRHQLGLWLPLLASGASGCGISVRSGLPAPATTLIPDDLVPRIDVDAAYAAVNAGRAFLVDVRGTDSWKAHHARGAMSLPVDDIERIPASAAAGLPAGKQPILYCT